jgi:hypothetical protein
VPRGGRRSGGSATSTWPMVHSSRSSVGDTGGHSQLSRPSCQPRKRRSRAAGLYFRAWFEGQEVVPGALGFLRTAGELLGRHPHLHVLLTDGG